MNTNSLMNLVAMTVGTYSWVLIFAALIGFLNPYISRNLELKSLIAQKYLPAVSIILSIAGAVFLVYFIDNILLIVLFALITPISTYVVMSGSFDRRKSRLEMKLEDKKLQELMKS